MHRCSIRKLILLAALAICIAPVDRRACAQSASRRSNANVVVLIRPVSTVKSTEVLLSDIAQIESTDKELQALVESLDIGDTPTSGEPLMIKRSRIEFRLRLAGIDVRRVTIRGDRAEVSLRDTADDGLPVQNSSAGDVVLTQATARNPKPSLASRSRVNSAAASRGSTSIQTDQNEERSCEEVIVSAARRCVLGQLPWNEDAISIRLAQSITREVQAIESAKCSVFAAELLSPGPPVGRVHVEVTVEGADNGVTKVPVTFDVRHFDDVVAARKPIPRGRAIQQDDLYVHRWDVTGSADYYSDTQKLVGTIARRPIAALQIIRDQDIEAQGTASATSNPVVIKRQDRVKMIAKIGDLSITVSGEAQQDGRVGETIRVQNVESKAIVQGRVIRANEVEITD